MTGQPPRERSVPIVGQLLDQLDERYRGIMTDRYGTECREFVSQLLFNAWADGYTTGFADDQHFTNLEKPSE